MDRLRNGLLMYFVPRSVSLLLRLSLPDLFQHHMSLSVPVTNRKEEPSKMSVSGVPPEELEELRTSLVTMSSMPKMDPAQEQVFCLTMFFREKSDLSPWKRLATVNNNKDSSSSTVCSCEPNA